MDEKFKALRAKYKEMRLTREGKSIGSWRKVSDNGYSKAEFKDDQGNHLEVRVSTVYAKTGNLRDSKNTKQVAVIDLNNREDKSFTVKGEGRDKTQELIKKINNHLKKYGVSVDWS